MATKTKRSKKRSRPAAVRSAPRRRTSTRPEMVNVSARDTGAVASREAGAVVKGGRDMSKPTKPKQKPKPPRPRTLDDVTVTVVTAPPRTLDDLTVKKGMQK